MRALATSILFAVLAGCAQQPLMNYSSDRPLTMMVSAAAADIQDGRARFREIWCAINADHGEQLPDYRDCEDVLVRLPGEAGPSGAPVNIGVSRQPVNVMLVPGVGWGCLQDYVALQYTAEANALKYGYGFDLIDVDALSGTSDNAARIRDAVMALPEPAGDRRLVLIGYSKGAPDILEALVTYPELTSRVGAVVSLAGAIGGSPLANKADADSVNLFRRIPGADCEPGKGGTVESLKTSVRRGWLATHKLPESVRYYSLIAFPEPDMISNMLQTSYKDLSLVDQRNDSQILYYDQVIPGSTVLGLLNGDHLAVGVPLNRTHPTLAKTLANHNDFPREVMLEAVVRFIEEDFAAD
jgi:pimeloyl-ACP methyl ester carboxylesterase